MRDHLGTLSTWDGSLGTYFLAWQDRISHSLGSGSGPSGHPQGPARMGAPALLSALQYQRMLGPSLTRALAGHLQELCLNNQLYLHHWASNHFAPHEAAGASVSQKPAFQTGILSARKVCAPPGLSLGSSDASSCRHQPALFFCSEEGPRPALSLRHRFQAPGQLDR